VSAALFHANVLFDYHAISAAHTPETGWLP
jgi:hypothetical protein